MRYNSLSAVIVCACIATIAGCGKKEEKNFTADDIPFLKELNSDIERFPQSDTLLLYRSRILMEQNYFALALEDCKRSWRLRHTVAAALCAYRSYLQQAQYAPCIEWLQTCLPALDSNENILYAMANTYALMGEKKQTFSLIKEMKNRDLDDELAYNAAILLSDMENEDREALFFIDRAMKKNAYNADALLMKAYLMIRLKDKETPRFLNELLSNESLKKKKADVLYLYGEYYSGMRDTKKAIDYYDKCLKEDWKFQSAYVGKAQRFREEKRYQEAIEQLTIASQVDKPNYIIMKETALSFLQLKDTSNAIEYFKAAMLIDSADDNIKRQIALISTNK